MYTKSDFDIRYLNEVTTVVYDRKWEYFPGQIYNTAFDAVELGGRTGSTHEQAFGARYSCRATSS